MFYWDPMRSDSPLFSELKAQPAKAAGETAATTSSALAAPAAATSEAAAATGLTTEAIHVAVTAAVAAVLGGDVGDDTPLVGAGLDSLGTCSGLLLWGLCEAV